MTPKMKICLTYEQDEQASADYDVKLSFSQEVAGQRVERAEKELLQNAQRPFPDQSSVSTN